MIARQGQGRGWFSYFCLGKLRLGKAPSLWLIAFLLNTKLKKGWIKKIEVGGISDT